VSYLRINITVRIYISIFRLMFLFPNIFNGSCLLLRVKVRY